MHHQHQGVHAHVARDVDGRKMIELLKRDTTFSDNLRQFIHIPSHNTNSETIKLNVPEGFAEKDITDTNDSGVATAVSVVYVTMSPTFSGSVLGYVTATPDASSSTDTAVDAATNVATSSSTPVAQAVVTSASTINGKSSAATTTHSSTVAMMQSVGTAPAATKSASSSTAVSDANNQQDLSLSQQNSGLTDGAKAGLAIGIILAVALVAGLFFFCFKRAKKNGHHDELNEKSAINEKRSSFFGGASKNKRASADSDKSFGTTHPATTAPRLSLRPVTQFLPGFGDKRKSSNMLAGPQQMSEKTGAWERRPEGENPFNDAQQTQAQANPFEEGDGRSIHSNGSDDSASRSATGAAAGQAGPRVANNVHRVQLDFKPSMDDELELKSGQLVRMLHEYDDGWALCVRMDRSQQGVAPRTCLSKTPVKPRGPPPGGRVSPQGHIPPPNAMRGPPPGSPRSMTPSQQSPGVARKPVPGQAI